MSRTRRQWLARFQLAAMKHQMLNGLRHEMVLTVPLGCTPTQKELGMRFWADVERRVKAAYA